MDDPVLKTICEKTGKTGAQVLIRWSLQSGFVPLPKSDTPSRIAENCGVFDFELDEDSMSRLNALDLGKVRLATLIAGHRLLESRGC